MFQNNLKWLVVFYPNIMNERIFKKYKNTYQLSGPPTEVSNRRRRAQIV